MTWRILFIPAAAFLAYLILKALLSWGDPMRASRRRK